MKILIVACGGFGVNMARETKELLNGNMEIGGSEIDALIIDGSDSNLRDNNDLSEFSQWLAPGKDGGGKIRKSNAKDYIEFLNSKIHEMPDADLYLVVSSTAGGSGSVFCPEVIKYLLKNNKRCIALNTVTTATTVDAQNSDNVVRGLAKYARATGKPIVSFLQNGDDTPEVEVNARIKAAIEALAYMASDKLGALDTSDVSSFLDYTPFGVQPTLTELVITSNVEEMRQDTGKWLTTLSVIPDTTIEQPKVNELLDVRAVGGDTTLYFGTRIDRMPTIASRLKETRAEKEAIANSHAAVVAFEDDDETMEY